MGRIASAEALQKIGIHVSSAGCKWCGFDPENADHILVTCPYAKKVWSWIWKWAGVQDQNFCSVNALLNFVETRGRNTTEKMMLATISYGVCWTLWKTRNERIFRSCFSSASRITDEIISLVFFWFKYRGNLANCNWQVWCIRPFDCM